MQTTSCFHVGGVSSTPGINSTRGRSTVLPLEELKNTVDIIVWGSDTKEVVYAPHRVIQILLKAGFTIKKSKVKGSGAGDSVLGNKMAEWMLCSYGCCQQDSNYVFVS